jgi:hypothetical protein
MPDDRPSRMLALLLTALSLSIGWGIRGNFGHEFGAMIPGALAAMACVLLSGRDDWWRRVAYFAMFGALGWSFGGSMSYMQVVAYTHSGHSASVLYGFACLFVIGFLWAALGGAGTALPACLGRDRLTELFAPLSAVFLAWWLQEALGEPAWHRFLAPRGYSLDWYDTDWLAALLAIVAVLILAAIRGRLDRATALVLYLAVGWWAGFLLLVVGLGLRMTPPRGDNWAGCVGMTAGLLAYCRRHRLGGVVLAAVVSGLIGGIGFAAASMLKLAEVTSGIETNWHSVLEQTTGLFNGVGIAVALRLLERTEPRLSDHPPRRRWTEPYAVGFVLLGITYLNLRKNPQQWVRAGAVPAVMAGLPARTWFDLAYLALAVAVLVPPVRHLRRPVTLVPATWTGKGQLLYFVFLWWVVVGNFERALAGFAPQRLVTEGVIHLNAALCTLLVLLGTRGEAVAIDPPIPSYRPLIRKAVAMGLVAAVAAVLADWGIVRAIYGDRFAGHAALHIRFGPNATTRKKPDPGPARPDGKADRRPVTRS